MATIESTSSPVFSPSPEPSALKPSADPAVFDASLIPVAPVHDFRIRADMRFSEAAAAYDEWMSSPISQEHARYRCKGTMTDVRTKFKALNRFFGPLKLNKIHVAQLREYQKMRFTNDRRIWANTAGANKINAELALVLRIMRLAEVPMSDIAKYFKTLQVDEGEIPISGQSLPILNVCS